MKTSAQLEAERLDLIAEVDALVTVAETEDRELSDEEQARFDEVMGEDGVAANLLAECESREKFEAARDKARQEIAAAKEGAVKLPLGAALITPRKPNSQPAVDLKGQKSKHFENARDAHVAGCWMQYQFVPGKREEAAAELQRFAGEEYAAQTAGAPNRGGIFIPQPMVTEIVKNRDSIGILPNVSRQFTMTSETLDVPREDSRPTVYYPGEDEDVTDSDVTIGDDQLKVKERACLVKLSRQLIANSAVSAADYVVDAMSYEMAYAMDNELINGDGTSTYGREEGLITTLASGQTKTAGTGDNTLDKLDSGDWTGTIGKLAGKYLSANPSWIMSRETWVGSVLPLSIAAGGNTVANLQSGLGGLTWLGYPVHLTDLLPAASASTIVALFGAWDRGVAFGDRNDMAFDTTNDRYFEQRKVGILVTHNYDILVHNTDAYTALKLAS